MSSAVQDISRATNPFSQENRLAPNTQSSDNWKKTFGTVNMSAVQNYSSIPSSNTPQLKHFRQTGFTEQMNNVTPNDYGQSAQYVKSHHPFDMNSAGVGSAGLPPGLGDRSQTSQSSLQQPDYGNINAIDNRLAQLEKEARQMEDKYAFIKQQQSQFLQETSQFNQQTPNQKNNMSQSQNQSLPMVHYQNNPNPQGKVINVKNQTQGQNRSAAQPVQNLANQVGDMSMSSTIHQSQMYDPHQSNFMASMEGVFDPNKPHYAAPVYGPMSDKMIEYSNMIKRERERSQEPLKQDLNDQSLTGLNFESNYARELMQQSKISSVNKKNRYQNLPQISQAVDIVQQSVMSGDGTNKSQMKSFTIKPQLATITQTQLNTIPEYPDGKSQAAVSSVMGEGRRSPIGGTNKIAHAKPVVLKPQITKEYIHSQTVGKPDFQILQSGYEQGSKFYEPQYSLIQNRKCHYDPIDVAKRPIQCYDEQIEKADVQFRETESQILHQKAVFERIQNDESEQFYDYFM